MNNRFVVNKHNLFLRIYITWGLWYVFFNASVILRPYYLYLWPLLAVGGAVVYLGRVLHFIKNDVSNHFALYMLFFVCCIFSLMVSIDRNASVDYFQRIFFAFAFAVVIASNDVGLLFFKIMRAFCLIMLIISFVQFFAPSVYNSIFLPLLSQKDSLLVMNAIRSNEAVGFTNGTSQNGLFMAIGFCAYSTKFIVQKKKKLFDIVCAVLFWGMTFATGKRGYSIITIIVFVIMLFFSLPKEERERGIIKRLFVLAVLLIFFIIAFNNIEILSAVLNKTMNLAKSGDVSNGRSSLYIQAWAEFKKHFWLGIGIDATKSSMGEAVHNSYLQWLLEFGIILIWIPMFALLNVPLFKIKSARYKMMTRDDDSRYLLGVSFALMIMILLSGFVAMPFQWPNVMLIYFLCQFEFLKVINLS